MGDKSKIEWCDASWSPIMGCTPVSEGCRNCYARTLMARFAGRPGWPESPDAVTLFPERIEQPLHWKKPRKIFVCSMGDLFHPDVPADFITWVYDVMAACRQHTFIVLTKRPERIVPVLYGEEGHWYLGGGDYLPNVWHLVSAENQEMADKRIPELLKLRNESCGWPVLGVSVEPCLESINCEKYLMSCDGCGNQGSTSYITRYDNQLCNRACIKGGEGPSLDWVICGGETGPNAHPMNPEWARGLRDQCVEAGVPFFFKSWGDWFPRDQWEDNPELVLPDDGVIDDRVHVWPDDEVSHRVGKKAAGRLLDGMEWNEFPSRKQEVGDD